MSDATAEAPVPVCGRPGDRAISGRTCTLEDSTGCAVRVAAGYAADSAKRLGTSNAGALQAMARKLSRDDTVCLGDAQTELRTWATETLGSRSATTRDKQWARDISEALNLGV